MTNDLEKRIIVALSGESPVLYKIASELRKLLRALKETEPLLEERFAPILLCVEFNDTGTADKGLKGYGPLSEIPDRNGLVRVYPHPSVFTDEMIDRAKAELDNVANPFIRARVYDVLWCLKSEFDLARNALDAYDEALSIQKSADTVLNAGASAGRMARLARLLNQADSYQRAVSHAISCSEAGLAAGGIGNVLRPFHSIVEIGERVTQEQASRLREVLRKGLAVAQDAGKPFDVTSYYEALADLERLQGAIEESDAALAKVAKSLENRVSMDATPGPLLQITWLEQALEVWARLGHSEAQARVRRKIQDLGPSVSDNLREISTPFEIPQEAIKELEENILSIGSLEEAIRVVTLSLPAIPDYEEMKRQAGKLRAEHPIQSLFSTVVMDERGPITHVDDTNREKFDAFQQMSLCWNLKLIMRINPAIRALTDMGLDFTHAMAMFEEENVVLLSKLTKDYIRLGFEEYFAEHYEAACVLLLLAIEGALRDLVVAASGRPTISYRDGQFSALSLGSMLDLIEVTPELKKGIGVEMFGFLRWFVGDRLGANLRNTVAHVLIDPGDLNKQLASFLVWLHWKFSSYRTRPSET